MNDFIKHYEEVIIKYDKEVMKLNNIIDKQDRDITTLTKEKIKLKNIINELEKYIGQEWYCFDDESVEHHVAWHILMRLKELKENKK